LIKATDLPYGGVELRRITKVMSIYPEEYPANLSTRMMRKTVMRSGKRWRNAVMRRKVRRPKILRVEEAVE